MFPSKNAVGESGCENINVEKKKRNTSRAEGVKHTRDERLRVEGTWSFGNLPL